MWYSIHHCQNLQVTLGIFRSPIDFLSLTILHDSLGRVQDSTHLTYFHISEFTSFITGHICLRLATFNQTASSLAEWNTALGKLV